MKITLDALRTSYRELIEGASVCRPNISTNIPIGRQDAFFKWSTMEGGSARSKFFAMRIKNDIWYRSVYGSGDNTVRTREWYSTRTGKFCGLILLVRIDNAEIVAIMNDSHIQRSRVGADGGIGTELMSNPDAEVLGILGSGGMARSHAAAITAVRKIKRIQVFSPTKAHRMAFAEELREHYGVEVDVMETPERVLGGADIVAGCTDGGFANVENCAEIAGKWVGAGTHFVSIGGGIDNEARQKTDVALRLGNAPAPVGVPEWGVKDEVICYGVPADSQESEGNDYYRECNSTRARGEMIPGKTIYLADLMSGKCSGRTDPGQITFSERGNLQGAQFHAVASRAYLGAVNAGLGREIPTEWFLQDERN